MKKAKSLSTLHNIVKSPSTKPSQLKRLSLPELHLIMLNPLADWVINDLEAVQAEFTNRLTSDILSIFEPLSMPFSAIQSQLEAAAHSLLNKVPILD